MNRIGPTARNHCHDCGHSPNDTHHVFDCPSKPNTLTAPNETAKHLNLAIDKTSQQQQLLASTSYSCEWLNTVFSSSTRILHDNDSVHIAITLRFGLSIYQLHRLCGKKIDKLGIHPLSCSHSADRCPPRADHKVAFDSLTYTMPLAFISCSCKQKFL